MVPIRHPRSPASSPPSRPPSRPASSSPVRSSSPVSSSSSLSHSGPASPPSSSTEPQLPRLVEHVTLMDLQPRGRLPLRLGTPALRASLATAVRGWPCHLSDSLLIRISTPWDFCCLQPGTETWRR